MLTFGNPSWATELPLGVPLPKFYAQWLAKRVTGTMMLRTAVHSPASISHRGALPATKCYASEFISGELGILVVNAGPTTSLEISGLNGVERHGRFDGGIQVNGWLLEANQSSILSQIGAGKPIDAPAVLLNGEGNGRLLGGPWPLDTIPPYAFSTSSPGTALTIDAPEASILALIVHSARPAYPSPPPQPPAPPPSPPPPCHTANYGPCLNTHCCLDPEFGCYKRPTLNYAQCRPYVRPCHDTDEWLCPGWWVH